jgi:hypothetical protein
MNESLRIAMIAILTSCFTASNSAGDWQNDWKNTWMSEMDEIGTKPIVQQIARLGAAARAKSTNGGFQRPTENQIAVGNRAVSMLLAIPGHAEYYRDRVVNMQKIRMAVARGEVPPVSVDGHQSYQGEQDEAFQILSLLPSSETVRVLGEFLADESDRPPPPKDENDELAVERYVMAKPNCDRAVRALTELLANPPVPAGSDYLFHRDLQTWRLWYEQVKAGNRTFRFEGDPTEYDLNGPAPKEKLERIALHQRMESERETRHGRKDTANGGNKGTTDEKPAAHESTAYTMIIASLALLVAMVWYFTRKPIRN